MSYVEQMDDAKFGTFKVDDTGMKVLIGVRDGKLIFRRLTAKKKFVSYTGLGIAREIEREELICN